MSHSWKGGSTRRWRTLRKALLEANRLENQGRCHLAIPGVCTGTADQIHHVRGKAQGDNPKHLVPSCKACNLKAGNPAQRASPKPRPTSRW